MPARHYNLEYNVNGGPWLSGNLDETPGQGKQLTIGGLAVGTYAVKLRMVPLSGDTTPIVSNEVIMQVGTPAITEPVFTAADSAVSVAEVITRRDTLLAAAGVTVTAADAQVMNEALFSTATESGSVITGFADTVTAAGSSDATVSTVQVMLEQVVAAITAADSSTSAATRVEATSSSADVVPSQTDTYQQAANTAPTFTVLPAQTGGSATTIVLSYTTADTEGDHYKLEYSIGAGWVVAVADEVAGAHTLTISGLTAGASYSVQLRATALTGNTTPIFTAGVSMATTPNAPSLSASAGNAQNTLTMSATGATSYNIYYTTDGSTPTLASAKISGVASPYTHSSLTNGTTYKYIATAVNASGESAASAVAAATPAAYPTTINNGASITSAPFNLTSIVANSGSIQQTASDTFTIDDTTNVTQGALLYNTTAWTGTYSHIIKITNYGNTASGAMWIPVLSAAPVISDAVTALANRKFRWGITQDGGANQGKIYISYVNTSGTEYFLQSNGTWGTSLYFLTIPVGSAQIKIERDATNYIVSILAADGTPIANGSGTIAISSVKNGSVSDYLALGDIATDYKGKATFQILS